MDEGDYGLIALVWQTSRNRHCLSNFISFICSSVIGTVSGDCPSFLDTL